MERHHVRIMTVTFTALSVLVVPTRGALYCVADLNSNGVVDLSDLAALLAHFGSDNGGTLENGDLDGDHDIDIADLSRLLRSFGEDCSQFRDGDYCTASGQIIYEFYPDGVLRRYADGFELPGDAQMVVWGFTGSDRRLIVTTETPSSSTERILELDGILGVAAMYTLSAGHSANAWITQTVVSPDNLYLYAVLFNSFTPSGPNTVKVLDRATGEEFQSFPTVGEEGVGITFNGGFVYVSGWSSTLIGQFQPSAPFEQIQLCPIGGPNGVSCGKLISGPYNHLFVVIYSDGPNFVQELEPTCGGLTSYATGTRQGWNIDFNANQQLVVCGSRGGTTVFETYDLGESAPVSTVELSSQINAQGLAVVPGAQ